ARSGGQAVRDALELLLNVPELTVGHSHSRVEQAGSVGRLPGAAGRCRPRAASSAGSLLLTPDLRRPPVAIFVSSVSAFDSSSSVWSSSSLASLRSSSSASVRAVPYAAIS